MAANYYFPHKPSPEDIEASLALPPGSVTLTDNGTELIVSVPTALSAADLAKLDNVMKGRGRVASTRAVR